MIILKEKVKNLYFVGRNYLAHAKELNNEKPDKVLLFTKPVSTICNNNTLNLPNHSDNIHFEGEMVFVLTNDLCNLNDETEIYVGCGLDFTARDVQAVAKSKGLPWFEAKCFQGSTVISNNFVKIKGKDLNNLKVKTAVNGVTKQDGNYTQKMFKLDEIAKHINNLMDFNKLDLVFTGTPAGVGKVSSGDKIKVSLFLNNKEITFCECEVV